MSRKTLKIYQVDAFTQRVFGGNPAAVCPLSEWLSDDEMQNIASENNLSETAFYVKVNSQYQIRWFTPSVEVDLCGHATFAAAYVLFNHENHQGQSINFYSPKSGQLSVSKMGNLLSLNFPEDNVQEVDLSADLLNAFDLKPKAAYKGKTDYLLIFKNEKEIKSLKPNLDKISKIQARGIIVSAKATHVDFVSRFFAPRVGVDEDPVTGSAHTSLIPFWSKALGKTELTAIQLSQRQGFLECKHIKNRVIISGYGKLYMSGDISIN